MKNNITQTQLGSSEFLMDELNSDLVQNVSLPETSENKNNDSPQLNHNSTLDSVNPDAFTGNIEGSALSIASATTQKGRLGQSFRQDDEQLLFGRLINSKERESQILTNNDAVAPMSNNNPLTKLKGGILSKSNLIGNPMMRTLGGQLTQLWSDFNNQAQNQSSRQQVLQNAKANPLLDINGQKVAMDFIVSSEAKVDVLMSELKNLGATNLSSYGNLISGEFPVAKMNQLVGKNNLIFARNSVAITNVGSTTSQADSASRADAARTIFGVDGSGVKVGVLSDSYNTSGNGSEAADIASGDLPSNVDVVEDLGNPGIDEGRAMLQLVHDLAPGSDLAFRTAFRGQADFAQGILDLATAGSDVIVDDIIYFAEPMFQDGVIAQAIDNVVAQGIPYFSSAGNSNRQSYESEFRGIDDSVVNINSDYLWHDFDPSAGTDVFQDFTLTAGQSISLSFQWDQPFASVGGAGSANDLDIFLLDNSGAINVIASSTDFNIGADAVELLFHTNNSGASQDVRLLIGQFIGTGGGGPTPNLIKYVDFDGNTNTAEFFTNSSTSFGHPNAAGASSVGAAFFGNTPAFGVNSPVVEDFSSTGGIPVLFDIAGNRLATPEVRQNVDITAPDGTNTTFFGGDIGFDSDSFPNFFGTSASAPHAAAVAALMLEAKPNATPTEIYDALEQTAIDMDDPFTAGFDTGYDVTTGFGLIQADLAIDALLNNGSGDFIVGTPGDDILDGGAGNDTLDGVSGDDTINANDGDDLVLGSSGNDSINGGAGIDSLDYSASTGAPISLLPTGSIEKAGGETDIFDGIETIVAPLGENNVVDTSADTGIDVKIDLKTGNVSIEGGNTSLFSSLDIANFVNAIAGDGSDTLVGDNNDNQLDGGSGGDILKGKNGDDTYLVDSANDIVVEVFNQGTDLVESSVHYTLSSNVENLTLVGNKARNAIGNNLGNSIIGNSKNNHFIGKNGKDTITGLDGNDLFFGNNGNDSLVGGNGNDAIHGNAGNDHILGEEGHDRLNGQNDRDKLIGGSGNDILVGGAGNDTLTGSSGADSFRYNSRNEGIDTITDFSETDDRFVIRRQGFGGGLSLGKIRSNQLAFGTSASNAHHRFIYDGATGNLFFDRDGTGSLAQQQLATLSTGLTLTRDDFIVI